MENTDLEGGDSDPSETVSMRQYRQTEKKHESGHAVTMPMAFLKNNTDRSVCNTIWYDDWMITEFVIST